MDYRDMMFMKNIETQGEYHAKVSGDFLLIGEGL